MTDLISRQAAIDLFPNDALEWDTNGGYIAPHLARRMIDELPSVDAVPVRHGKWLYIRTDEDKNGVYECSECHAGEVHSSVVDVRYCWNCGAKMDEERKSE